MCEFDEQLEDQSVALNALSAGEAEQLKSDSAAHLALRVAEATGQLLAMALAAQPNLPPARIIAIRAPLIEAARRLVGGS